MRAPRDTRDVVLLVDPVHALGQAVCRELCLRGYHPVATSAEPADGDAFGVRMALEGFTVPHRALHDDDDRCEARLAQDLEAVYGGLRGVLTFFSPPRRREKWLELPLTAANELLRESLKRRLRLLRALSPLLGAQGFMQGIVMGVLDEDGEPRGDAGEAAGRLWDDLLAGEWERRGVVVRRTYTRLTARARAVRGALPAELARVLRDFDRCVERTAGSAAA